MAYPIGVYTCKIDDKGRITLPRPLKEQLQGVINEGFVLKASNHQKCLELYSKGKWNSMIDKLEKLDPFQRDTDIFIRSFLKSHQDLEVDKIGRMTIAKELISFAGISKDVVIACSIGKIEVWDRVNYETATTMTPEEFAELASRVMPGKEQ